MYDAINTLASKEQERRRIAALMDQHVSAGKPVTTLVGFTPKPMPPRGNKIDPDTVLKRRRPAITAADRRILRELAEAL
jgi:hypothetical protein